LEGKRVWFEVDEDFAEIYNKYNRKEINGVWDVKQGRILPPEEYPNCDSIEEQVENFIWGTRGKDGKSPLKYVLLKNCDTDHLQNILKDVKHIQAETKKVIEYILKNREVVM
jgi:hypothetical protein